MDRKAEEGLNVMDRPRGKMSDKQHSPYYKWDRSSNPNNTSSFFIDPKLLTRPFATREVSSPESFIHLFT